MHNKIKDLEEAVQRLSAYYGSSRVAASHIVCEEYEKMFWEQLKVVNNISDELVELYPNGFSVKMCERVERAMDKASELTEKMLENEI